MPRSLAYDFAFSPSGMSRDLRIPIWQVILLYIDFEPDNKVSQQKISIHNIRQC